ncbi:beta-ketoacyl-ACP synthase III [Actinomadura mexicana]|uniref:3-oxoacyl-[acyl-carrier-protein] synthase-3 n=1 Tax=Actinomadura mexicana TaxID=134959 RepID=A0A238V177_9ACTN|nr:beta-ketoacyl-ACP synthase III [Actinomadura mexicana]SNR27767.1 3-oxoacyl-[acyl-carrier-protein] synthase-3 [Actinomadura mexicana]
MNGSRILALGHYQPSRILSNDELAARLDTSDEWITRRVGIQRRRIAAVGETVDQMAAHAGADALDGCGLPLDSVDLVVVATCTATERAPNVAARVAADLHLRNCAVIDVNTACSGFTHALAIADHSIRSGAAGHALVIGADKLSDVVDWDDRSVSVLIGDGAGAAVVGRAATQGIGPVVWGAAPEKARAILIEGNPPRFTQDGTAVFRWAVTEVARHARAACDLAGVPPAELAAVVFHQANLRIIEKLAAQLGAVNAILADDVRESGNTSAASIPLALSKLVEQNRIPPGAPVLLFGFGGGLAYAGQVILCPEFSGRGGGAPLLEH